MLVPVRRIDPSPRSKRVFFAAGALTLALMLAPPALMAAQQRADMSKSLGERAPIFSLATSQGKLADYDRDYYGQHHLVLTFIPAAFTPV